MRIVRTLSLCVLAVPLGCSGGWPSFGACDPPFSDRVFPTAIAVFDDSILVASTWFERKGACGRGRVGAAVHRIERPGNEQSSISLGGPSTRGLSLEQGLFLLDEDDGGGTLFRLDGESERIDFPASIRAQVTSSGSAVLLLENETLLRIGARDFGPVHAPSGSRDLATGFGAYWVVSDASAHRLDPETLLEVDSLPTCPTRSIGSINQRIAVACSGGGLNLVSTTAGLVITATPPTPSTESIEDIFSEEGHPFGIAQIQITEPSGNARMFDEEGLFGLALGGPVDSLPIFTSSTNAVVVLDGIAMELVASPFEDGRKASPNTHIVSEQIASTSTGTIVIASGSYTSLTIYEIDPISLVPLNPGIEIDPPSVFFYEEE